MSPTVNPVGKGSVGSTTTVQCCVIHARPVTDGSTAGSPPTVVSPRSLASSRADDDLHEALAERELALRAGTPSPRTCGLRRAVEHRRSRRGS